MTYLRIVSRNNMKRETFIKEHWTSVQMDVIRKNRMDATNKEHVALAKKEAYHILNEWFDKLEGDSDER